MRLSKFGIHRITSLLQLFLVIIAIGLSGATILFHSWTVFSTPSNIVYISNLPAVSSSCLAIASFLLHLVLATRTPPPKVTNRDSRFLLYKQHFLFGLLVLTTIPNALLCKALFRHRDLEHNRLANVVKLVCLLHGFLVEVRRPSIPHPVVNEDLLIFFLSLSPWQMLGKNLEVYRMKHKRFRVIKLARATVTAAVVLQILLLGSGVPSSSSSTSRSFGSYPPSCYGRNSPSAS